MAFPLLLLGAGETDKPGTYLFGTAYRIYRGSVLGWPLTDGAGAFGGWAGFVPASVCAFASHWQICANLDRTSETAPSSKTTSCGTPLRSRTRTNSFPLSVRERMNGMGGGDNK